MGGSQPSYKCERLGEVGGILEYLSVQEVGTAALVLKLQG